MEDLSNIHEYAAELVNIPGVTSPILEFEPEDGIGLRVRNNAARGSAVGVPIYLDLRDSNGDQLPVGTSVRFEYESPTSEERNRVSEIRDNIQQYRALDIRDQQDEDYVDSVKIPLLGPNVEVRSIDSFYLSIESSTEIDWSQSAAYIEGDVVDKVKTN